MCRAGCSTQNHKTYSACLKDSGIRIAYTNSANGYDYTKQKKWDGELERFRGMEAAGMSPLGTTHAEMDRTEKTVESFGKVNDSMALGEY